MRSMVLVGRSRGRGAAVGIAVALALVASLFVVPSASALSDTGDGGLFVPAAGRILDTRTGTGGFNTVMPTKQWRTVKVAGQAGLPVDGISAVSIMASVVQPSTNGNLQGRPDASTQAALLLNYGGLNDQNFSNTGVLAVADDGTIQLMTEQANHLVIDVQGYYTSSENGTAAGGFVPVPGKRVIDTRSGLGAPAVELTNGQSITTQITGQNGVPAGATAIAANFIVVNQTTNSGYITPFAAGTAKPSTSLNYPGDSRGLATSIGAQVGLSSAGKLSITTTTGTGGSVDVVVDIQGYFTKGDNGAVFTPAAARIADTRVSPYSVVQAGAEVSIPVAGVKGIPVSGSGLTAVAMTLSAINGSTTGGWATVWPDGTAAPAATSINYVPNNIRSNTVIAQVGTNGKIRIKNGGANPIHFILDLQGWFTDPQAPKVACQAPYLPGSWNDTLPSSEVSCSVAVSAATESGAFLRILVNDQIWTESDLSEAVDQIVTVAVAPFAGKNVITAQLMANDGAILAATDYMYGLGNWATKKLMPVPEDGATVPTNPSLYVQPDGDAFSDGVQGTFTVSTKSDGMTSPIISEPWDGYGFEISAGTLQPRTTYYWSVLLNGSSGASESKKSVRSPVWSFTTSDEEGAPSQVYVEGAPTQESTSFSIAQNTADTGPEVIVDEWRDYTGYRMFLRSKYRDKLRTLHAITNRIVWVNATRYPDGYKMVENSKNARVYLATFQRRDSRTGRVLSHQQVRVVMGMRYDKAYGSYPGVVSAYCPPIRGLCPTWVNGAK